MSNTDPVTVSDAASNIARHGGIAPTRFDRLENDSYFTLDAPWIIPALLSQVEIRARSSSPRPASAIWLLNSGVSDSKSSLLTSGLTKTR